MYPIYCTIYIRSRHPNENLPIVQTAQTAELQKTIHTVNCPPKSSGERFNTCMAVFKQVARFISNQPVQQFNDYLECITRLQSLVLDGNVTSVLAALKSVLERPMEDVEQPSTSYAPTVIGVILKVESHDSDTEECC